MAAERIDVLRGEGDTKIVLRTRVRRNCERCGEPATKRISFCYFNGRRNPASSMYGRDDCTYCSDAEAFACDECAPTVKREDCPHGMEWCSTFSSGGSHDHMLLYWSDCEVTLDEVAALSRMGEGA